jgi:MFS family permease
MILPAIPDFIHEFNISYSTSSWLLSAYIIAAAVMTPIGGKLSDLYGKKKILLIIMAVYIAGILAGRFATTIEYMLAARVAQGVGMAMFPIAFGIIREVLPENRLAIGQTIFTSTFSGGAVIGLIGGAAIIQNFGWQMTFLAILPGAIALWLIVAKFVRVENPISSVENENENHRGKGSKFGTMDIKGTLSLAATIITFLAGITFLESKNDGAVVGLFVASGVSVTLFIVIEKKVHFPLFDFKLMTDKNFLAPTIILMLVGMSIFMVYLTIPVLVRSPSPFGFGGSALAVASVQLPFMIVLLIGTITSGFILNRIKNTKLMLFGTTISTIGFIVVLLFHSTENMISIGLTVLAAGLSLSISGGFNVILISVPMEVTGIALGMTLLLNLVGMSVGPAISGVFQETYKGTAPGIIGAFPTGHAYNMIFTTAAIISLASVAITVSMSKIRVNETATTTTAREPREPNADHR